MIAMLMAWILTIEVALLMGNIIYVALKSITQTVEKVTE